MDNFDDLLTGAAPEEKPQFSKEEFIEKKQAERRAVFELSDKTALEVSCSGERFQDYLNAQATLDRYSVVNTLLVLAQRPSATRLGDFDFWKERGGRVKSGQTAISILEPHEYTKDDGSSGVGYNVKKVFDASQVGGRKLKIKPPPEYSERQILSALINSAMVAVVGVDELSATQHVDKIEVRKGMGFADSFQYLALEICNREMSAGADEQRDAAFAAYSAAYVLCRRYGVDAQDFDFSSAPDILTNMDAQEVKAELSHIRACAAEISGRMARQLDAQERAAKNQGAR